LLIGCGDCTSSPAVLDGGISQQTLKATFAKVADMNADLASLHKILKDETRRQILLLLNEKPFAYTELMAGTDVISTGTLNYHLKVLGDLIAKNESGQYTLSEKGKVAVGLITQFPDVDYSAEEKKLWWRRFWIASTAIIIAGLTFVIALNLLGYLSSVYVIQTIFASGMSFVFLYFFYRMIKPTSKPANSAQSQAQMEPTRTVADIFVSGHTLTEVSDKIQEWVKLEGITVEAQHENYLRGRLGIPSGLGLTAPKYFEILCNPKDGGVNVHTEGWISVFDVREMSFTSNPWAKGSIPRRKGQKVIEHLWSMLKEN
jgi:DNA-binding transcriptional ArsR family regulator/membrane protein implicated in regulation of membrane protease activity